MKALGAAALTTLSVGIHASVVTVFLLFAPPTSASYPPPPPATIDVTVEPALGQATGSPTGIGLGSHVESMPTPAAARAPSHHALPPDPNAIATATAPPATTASADSKLLPPASAVPISALTAPPGGGDPTTPVGSANTPPAIGNPLGSPDGTGTGPAKPHMSPQYRGIISGWFGSRFNVRGLGIDPEELKKLSVGVSITVTPDRRVVGFSLSGTSGNAAYDDQVRRTMSSIQASGVTLPEPPDDSVLPSSFAIRFRPQNIH
jgi:hypothetical protein